MPMMGDSLHHRPSFDPYSASSLLAIPELVWMMQTDADEANIGPLARDLTPFSDAMSKLVSFMAAFSLSSKLDAKEFSKLAADVETALSGVQPLDLFRRKLSEFMREVDEFVRLVNTSDAPALRSFIVSTKHLFKGAAGNRHIDIIAYKPA